MTRNRSPSVGSVVVPRVGGCSGPHPISVLPLSTLRQAIDPTVVCPVAAVVGPTTPSPAAGPIVALVSQDHAPAHFPTVRIQPFAASMGTSLHGVSAQTCPSASTCPVGRWRPTRQCVLSGELSFVRSCTFLLVSIISGVRELCGAGGTSGFSNFSSSSASVSSCCATWAVNFEAKSS